jgi:hypothetical protein
VWNAISLVLTTALLLSAQARSGDTVAVAACAETPTVRDEPPKDPGATRFGFGPWQVKADRTIWAHAAHARHWTPGSYGNKVLWIRQKGTQLEIAGRRLDGDAPPLRARIPCCYSKGFQSTRLYFPEKGCWEVTARAGMSELTFVRRVQSSPPPFESELFPGEGQPVFRSETDRLSLREAPSRSAPLVREVRVEKGDPIAFDETRYQTIEPGRLRARRPVVVMGRSLGSLAYVSKEAYYSAAFPHAAWRWPQATQSNTSSTARRARAS